MDARAIACVVTRPATLSAAWYAQQFAAMTSARSLTTDELPQIGELVRDFKFEGGVPWPELLRVVSSRPLPRLYDKPTDWPPDVPRCHDLSIVDTRFVDSTPDVLSGHVNVNGNERTGMSVSLLHNANNRCYLHATLSVIAALPVTWSYTDFGRFANKNANFQGAIRPNDLFSQYGLVLSYLRFGTTMRNITPDIVEGCMTNLASHVDDGLRKVHSSTPDGPNTHHSAGEVIMVPGLDAFGHHTSVRQDLVASLFSGDNPFFVHEIKHPIRTICDTHHRTASRDNEPYRRVLPVDTFVGVDGSVCVSRSLQHMCVQDEVLTANNAWKCGVEDGQPHRTRRRRDKFVLPRYTTHKDQQHRKFLFLSMYPPSDVNGARIPVRSYTLERLVWLPTRQNEPRVLLRLRGVVMHTGGHYYAIVESDGRAWRVVDDVADAASNPLSFEQVRDHVQNRVVQNRFWPELLVYSVHRFP